MPLRLLASLLTASVILAPGAAAADPPAGQPGVWTAPLVGSLRVTRPFEPPPSEYGPGHRGVDLGGSPGRPGVAAGAGIVLFAGMVAGRPVVSIVHTNGLRTTYEPVLASVGAGQAVARGSPIGRLAPGHAACPVTACLHWGLRRGEAYLDPMRLLHPPRIRLLPRPEGDR